MGDKIIPVFDYNDDMIELQLNDDKRMLEVVVGSEIRDFNKLRLLNLIVQLQLLEQQMVD